LIAVDNILAAMREYHEHLLLPTKIKAAALAGGSREARMML